MNSQNNEGINNIKLQLADLDKRLMYLENILKKIELEISNSDEKLEISKNKIKHGLEILNKRDANIKLYINKLNKNVFKSISIIKHLAHRNEMNNLNEKLKHLKIDELVSENDIRKMVQSRLKLEKESISNY
jgi:hypothetical protein